MKIKVIDKNTISIDDYCLSLLEIEVLYGTLKQLKFWVNQLEKYKNPDDNLYTKAIKGHWKFRLDIDLRNYFFRNRLLYHRDLYHDEEFINLHIKHTLKTEYQDEVISFFHNRESELKIIQDWLKGNIIYPTLLDWNKELKVWDQNQEWEIEKCFNLKIVE